jgi:aspartyl-tRNA(Asn)/glutamyl-tRNA(Gln) amidotransferase subunit B
MAEQSSILHRYPEYECTIGIEVHVQLNTKSKIFCTCSNEPVQEPNTNIDQICCGYPGVLPVLNKQVVHNAILAGLATNCTITPVSEFARKHYFYPDLPKNYQITQSDKPICKNGHVAIRLADGSKKNVRLIRIHMEEDAGKNIHAGHTNESFVDLNRTGTPLLEIVSHPDISSAEEAKAYLKTLRLIVVYLGISTGNMQEGSFRADTNISVRKKGDPKLGTRAELKNINSFKFIGDAIEYEIERQIELLESGQKVKQETRLWDTKEHVTRPMRSKEEAADYRYFEDPDLPLIEIDQSMVDAAKKTMPELPEERFERYCTQKGITPYEADILIEDPELSNYFEQATHYTSSKSLVNWILRDLMGYLKEEKISLSECKITPEKLANIVDLLDKGVINNRGAQEVFVIVAKTGQNPRDVVKERGLEQIQSTDEIERIIKQVLEQNPQQVAEYKAGKEKMFGFFVGQIMQKTQGKGNPKIIQEILKKLLQ